MKNLLWNFCLTFILLGAPSAAQEGIFPPESARVITGSEGVVLQWPGSPKLIYLVEIFAGQKPVLQQQVTWNSIVVPLKAGIGYQWKVTAVKGSGEVVASRGFQVVNDTQVVVAAANGAAGGLGSRRTNYVGQEGKAGASGLNLTATLEPAGQYVRLAVTGAPANRLFYLAPGAPPIVLASKGGQGGAGGPGYNGRDANFNYSTGYITIAEPGGDGGIGGDGGAGGTINVIANRLPVDDYLRFDTRGGQGGNGGPGGRGGEGVAVPVQWQGRRLPQAPGYGQLRAPNGLAGVPGRQGPDGQVVVR